MSVGKIGWESLRFCSKRWGSGHFERCAFKLRLVSANKPLIAQANSKTSSTDLRSYDGVPEQFSGRVRSNSLIRVNRGLCTPFQRPKESKVPSTVVFVDMYASFLILQRIYTVSRVPSPYSDIHWTLFCRYDFESTSTYDNHCEDLFPSRYRSTRPSRRE